MAAGRETGCSYTATAKGFVVGPSKPPSAAVCGFCDRFATIQCQSSARHSSAFSEGRAARRENEAMSTREPRSTTSVRSTVTVWAR